MGQNLVDQPSKNEIEIACSFAHGSQWDFGKIPNGDSNNLWARRARFFLHIFTKFCKDTPAKEKILQRHAGQGAENEIEIDGVSCNGPGARENFFDPIQAGQSAENEIEIALVSCTGSGSRAVQAKTK